MRAAPEMDQGSALRYLAEMIWFPTAWLSDYIQWEAIDAHLEPRPCTTSLASAVSAVLHINEQGQPTQITTNRFMEEHGHYRTHTVVRSVQRVSGGGMG